MRQNSVWFLNNPQQWGPSTCFLAVQALVRLGPCVVRSWYGTSKLLSIEVFSSLIYTSMSCIGAGCSDIWFFSMSGVWSPNHFHDLTQIFLFKLYFARRLRSLMLIVALKGESNWGKLTVYQLVIDTSPIFFMISTPINRSYSSRFSSTTRTSTLIERLSHTPIWTSPTQHHVRVSSPTVSTSTSFLFQKWQSDLLTSDREQPVSTKVGPLIPLMCTLTAGTTTFRWDSGIGMALKSLLLAHFQDNFVSSSLQNDFAICHRWNDDILWHRLDAQ